jgi:probable rRNA maturation factor
MPRPDQDRASTRDEGAARAAPAVLRVELQRATRAQRVPAAVTLRRWATAAYVAGVAALPATRRKSLTRDGGEAGSLCVRVVGLAESRRLNAGYRGKDKATNVLSFPASAEQRRCDGALGDLVVCAPVVAREAREQHKALRAHWAHMVVHGTLHLLGYDHERPRPARRMEALEVEIVRGFGFDDPYLQVTDRSI